MYLQETQTIQEYQMVVAYLRGVFKDVAHNLHGELGRVDVRVANHKLLQYVILDGPCQLVRLHSLHVHAHSHICKLYRKLYAIIQENTSAYCKCLQKRFSLE